MDSLNCWLEVKEPQKGTCQGRSFVYRREMKEPPTMKTYRLLNEGEVIQEQTEVRLPFYYSFDEQFHWEKLPSTRIGEKSQPGFIYRCPTANESQWISIKERKPTKEDGGLVIVRYSDQGCNCLSWSFVADGYSCATHWCRIPKFVEQDPFEEWLKDDRRNEAGASSNPLLHMKAAFNAGRDYEKGKK